MMPLLYNCTVRSEGVGHVGGRGKGCSIEDRESRGEEDMEDKGIKKGAK